MVAAKGAKQKTSNAVVDPQLATVKQAADLLTVHRSTVYRMIDNGELPIVMVTQSTIRIPWKALRAIVANEQFKSAS